MRRFLISAALAASSIALASAAGALPIASDDPILFWNDRAVTLVTGPPPRQTRTYAMVNIAMHDAVNAALGGPNTPYLGGVASPGGDTRAAASQAARNVLVALDPANTAAYDLALAASLAEVPDGLAETNGRATGAAYASAILANRGADGAGAVAAYATTGLPGDWRPTPPMFAAAALPHWGGVTPFVMASGDQFRPGPPPALDSAEYAAAYDEVKAIGSATSATRDPDQTASALFWDAANGAPWLKIGVTVAEDEGLATIEYARAFALLTTSLADALIAGFDAKYHYRLWRPVTAIREGDADGNAATMGDPDWNSLFPSPAHPSYLSTHSALSGAGSTILAAIFGDDQGFDLTIAGDTRSFDGLADAALDGANSRLWGGIHFAFDNVAGLETGERIALLALRRPIFNQVAEPAVAGVLGLGLAALLAARRRQRRG